MQEMIFDAGILITAIFGVIGYLWKLGRQQKESARTLLFHLLEIRHELLIERPRLDSLIDEFHSQLAAILGDRPKLKSLMIDQVPKDYMTTTLVTLMDGLVRADAKLLASYESALFDYSRINPFLTNRIRGMKLLPKLSENLANMVSTVADAMPGGKRDDLVVSVGRMELESSRHQAVEELVADLERVIRRVSLGAGLRFWVQSCFLTSRRQKRDTKKEALNVDLSELIERFFKSVLLATNPPNDVKNQIDAAALEDLLDIIEASFDDSTD